MFFTMSPGSLRDWSFYLHVICTVVLDAMLGVFHLRSAKGQYKLNYTAAQQACSAEGGSLATYTQLSYAQQVSELRIIKLKTLGTELKTY